MTSTGDTAPHGARAGTEWHTIRSCGDRALLIEVTDEHGAVALTAALESLPGIEELVPGARTVLVRFDGVPGRAAALRSALRSLARPSRSARPAEAGSVELPTRYDGPDLEHVAAAVGLDVHELVARHAAAVYTVAFIGFAPGFAYLLGGDPALTVPRRSAPRARVPGGSVALADTYSGVYPRPSPGGWQLIGRTEVRLWDLDARPPALLTPGTTVRFVPIGPA